MNRLKLILTIEASLDFLGSTSPTQKFELIRSDILTAMSMGVLEMITKSRVYINKPPNLHGKAELLIVGEIDCIKNAVSLLINECLVCALDKKAISKLDKLCKSTSTFHEDDVLSTFIYKVECDVVYS